MTPPPPPLPPQPQNRHNSESLPSTQLEQVRVGVGVFVLKLPSSSSPTPLQTTQNPRHNPTVLIGKRLSSHGAGTYALPGGHLEFGETPEFCAARELREETGLVVSEDDVRFLTATNSFFRGRDGGGKQYITLFMVVPLGLGEDGREQMPRVLEVDKCEGWEWTQWDDLGALAERQRLKKGGGDGIEGGEEKVLFEPLINLFVQRPGIVPG